MLTPYRIVWVLVLFDLPVVTPENKRVYRLFREFLLEDGYDMMQYSVYARHCPSEERAAVHRARVKENVPAGGHVRVLSITDKQLSRMEVYLGKRVREPEEGPQQLEFL